MKGICGIISANGHPVMNYAVRNSKFAAEKICAANQRWLIHFDGILFSHAKPASDCERFDLLTGLYEKHGASMAAHVKGQFVLALWDKANGKVLITNDLLSKRSLYYCILDQKLFYAASYYDLLDLLKADGSCHPAVSADAVQAMASGGVLTGNATFAEGVHYLDAFEAIEFDISSGSASIVSIQPRSIRAASSMEEAISLFDELFTKAVEAQFRKNAEYGYEHFIALSGGMDSRACLLKAVKCGFDRDITCVTYSQAGSIDYTVSQQIAFDNGLDYLFYPMDAAVFMNRLSDAMDANECQQSSIGSTGAGTLARLLDKTRMGIMHVGLCGGELMGDLVSCAHGGRVQKALGMLGLARPDAGSYTFRLRDYLDNVRACQNFSSMFLAECETVSPFLDEDVVQFVTSLSPHLLYRRELYRKWMIRHIPNDYPTTMFCGPVSISPVRELLNKVADRIVRLVAGASRRDMNPIEFWFKNHPHLGADCTAALESGMARLRSGGVDESILAVLKEAASRDGEHLLYALTAIRALDDVLGRFGPLS